MRCLLPLLLQPSLAWARSSEVPLAGVVRRENCGVRHKPRVNPVTPRTIGATATPPKLQKGPTRPSRAALPQLGDEQPPQGVSKQGADTDQQKGFV